MPRYRLYAFFPMEDDEYDFDNEISMKEAITRAMSGETIAVLDAITLEYLGYIN